MKSSQEKIHPMFTKNNNRCWAIAVVVGFVAGFVAGILIGRFATCPDSKSDDRKGLFLPGIAEDLMSDEYPDISKLIMDELKSDNIRNNLKNLSAEPHLAGQERNYILAQYIKAFWEENGIEHVTLTPYDVLLSYPNMSDLSYVEMLNENNTSVFKSDLLEPALTDADNKSGVVPPFNAYSASGDLTNGTLVYVNYGRVQDYEYLSNNSINITGKIVIARYGKIFRGDKVHIAEMWGAIGVILYSDPKDITKCNASACDTFQVYPRDWWLPPTGSQRGTVFIGDGDPLTADYPAIASAYRQLAPEFYLPKIPVHPIGYGFAVKLMSQLGGKEVPKDWRGGMNTTYKFGDSFQNPGWKLNLKVTTFNQRATTYNAVGIIKGRVEPDRYVIIGNHRDAWVLGALDPSSGTAIMMEIARVFGQLVKSGRWRPRRTLVFCSWGAEEYGLIGSTEWVEHYTKSLGARAVAYLNVDIAVEGNFSLIAEGTPLLFKSAFEAAKKVPNPNPDEVKSDRLTVYDTWLKTFPSDALSRPFIGIPGDGSDYGAFRDRIGVPILDIRYTPDPNANLSTYPMYHSMYETFYLVDKIMDIGFKYHLAVGQVWAEMARHLSDSLLIPFDVSDYSAVLEDFGKNILSGFGDIMHSNGINTTQLTEAIANFTDSIHAFQQQVKLANLNDPFVVRLINDQLMQLDRAFVDPAGLPGRQLKRHILFAASLYDNYAGSGFPGLSDALTEISLQHNVTEQWDIVKKHFSVILYSLQSASSTLKDVTNFMYEY